MTDWAKNRKNILIKGIDLLLDKGYIGELQYNSIYHKIEEDYKEGCL